MSIPVSSVGDDQSLVPTSYTYRNTSSALDSNSSHYSGGSSSKWKCVGGRPNNEELLFRLFNQRDSWRRYGKLTVFCSKIFIVAPVKLWWWMVEIFVLSTVSVFAYETFYVNWIILIPAVIIAILEWMAFYKTCMRDPGVLPKPDFVDAFKNLISVLATWNGGPATKRIVVHPNRQQEELHYCWRCHHFRSSQTSHCGICDCCMIMHDHHCPVFGGCVAKNNTSSFHTMIITMGIFWLYMFGICIYNTIAKSETDIHSTISNPIQLTCYLIVAEILLVFTIPISVNCIKEMFCKSSRKIHQELNSSTLKEAYDEILKFARDNNFYLQEEMQLVEILQIQDSREGEGGSQDVVNHNSVYTKKQ